MDLKAMGMRIRQSRKIKGLTQADLASRINVSTMSIRRYESGERIVTEEISKRIASALDVDVNWLMNGQTLEEWNQAWKDRVARRFEEANIWKEGKDRINTAFDSLNTSGQQEAVKRVEELTELPRYRRTPEPSPLSAGIKVYGDGPAGSFPPVPEPTQPPAEVAPAQGTPAAQDAPEGDEKPE